MKTRPLYWSVRREIWENRSIYLAPLAVAALVVFALALGLPQMPRKLAAAAGDPAGHFAVAVRPFRVAPAPIMAMTFLVGMFYALGTLHGERRDRSLLFWKSLPVSDVTTVLAKAFIPLVALPVVAFVLSLAAMVVLLVPATLVLGTHGVETGRVWMDVLIAQPPIMIYGLVVHALWFAPIYAYLMLVSGWARRAPFLWAMAPVALSVVERVTFQTTYVSAFLRYRASGAMAEAFVPGAASRGDVSHVMELDPVGFVTTPGLWGGLAAAAVFLAIAVRLRRRSEPI